MCGGSPLFLEMFFVYMFIFMFICVGENTQERRYLMDTLVLPSMIRNIDVVFGSELHVGENTQGRFLMNTLVLPSMNRNSCFLILRCLLFVQFVYFHFEVVHFDDLPF